MVRKVDGGVGNGVLPSVDEIIAAMRKTGKNQSDIAREYGATPQAVSAKLTRASVAKTPIRSLPWKVSSQISKSRFYRTVVAARRLELDEPADPAYRAAARDMLNTARDLNLVLTYQYDVGFMTRPREADDNTESMFV